jgi:hypothetical protein
MMSIALGVAIGVTFVFMLFSLFLSTVLEAIASLMKLRGRALRVAIARLIGDPAHQPKRGGFGLVDKLMPANADANGTPQVLVADPVDPDFPEHHEAPTESHDGDCVAPTPLSFVTVFCHPLVGGADAKSTPSYVSAQNFSTAVLQALRSESGPTFADLQRRVAALPQGQLRQALQTALDEAEGNVTRFKAGIERWYDHAMARLGGWYKRFSQLATFLLGLGLAAAFNIDAVGIAKRLYVDPVMRQIIEQQAVDYVNNPPPQLAAAVAASAPAAVPDAGAAPAAASEAVAAADTGAAASAAAPADVKAQVADFEDKLKRTQEARELLLQTVPFVADQAARPTTLQGWIEAAIGWVITALAGMLGAPFWFQLLQRFVNLRGAGAKPAAPTAKAGEAP